jgi:hypothetical protein
MKTRNVFYPLSSYIVDGVLSGYGGSYNPNIVRIAEGRPPEPSPGNNDEESDLSFAVKYTLKITFKSTLPNEF